MGMATVLFGQSDKDIHPLGILQQHLIIEHGVTQVPLSDNTEDQPTYSLQHPHILQQSSYLPQRKPLFCRLEDQLTNAFNFGVKIRVGEMWEY